MERRSKIIFIVLARSRNVLLELTKRGLWGDRLVGEASRNMCILGGLFFVVGYVGFFGRILFPTCWPPGSRRSCSVRSLICNRYVHKRRR